MYHTSISQGRMEAVAGFRLLITLIALYFLHNTDATPSQYSPDPHLTMQTWACTHFYGENSVTQAPAEGGERLALPLISTFQLPRSKNSVPFQEVVVSHEYKFVYINVRKSASSTTMEMIKSNFKTDWQWCHNGNDTRLEEIAPYMDNGIRCTTMLLTEEMVQSYFFFSFVRDPLDRAISGYAQYVFQVRKLHPRLGSKTHFEKTINEMLGSRQPSNEHLENQIKSLSTPWREGRRIPIDFLGRVEQFGQDWQEAMRRIQAHSGKDLPVVRKLRAVSNRRPSKPVYKNQLNQTTIRAIVELYSQDYTCFGYPRPL